MSFSDWMAGAKKCIDDYNRIAGLSDVVAPIDPSNLSRDSIVFAYICYLCDFDADDIPEPYRVLREYDVSRHYIILFMMYWICIDPDGENSLAPYRMPNYIPVTVVTSAEYRSMLHDCIQEFGGVPVLHYKSNAFKIVFDRLHRHALCGSVPNTSTIVAGVYAASLLVRYMPGYVTRVLGDMTSMDDVNTILHGYHIRPWADMESIHPEYIPIVSRFIHIRHIAAAVHAIGFSHETRDIVDDLMESHSLNTSTINIIYIEHLIDIGDMEGALRRLSQCKPIET